jgi:hypothetical protein
MVVARDVVGQRDLPAFKSLVQHQPAVAGDHQRPIAISKEAVPKCFLNTALIGRFLPDQQYGRITEAQRYSDK